MEEEREGERKRREREWLGRDERSDYSERERLGRREREWESRVLGRAERERPDREWADREAAERERKRPRESDADEGIWRAGACTPPAVLRGARVVRLREEQRHLATMLAEEEYKHMHMK